MEEHFFDRKLLKFLLVGVCNTLIGAGVMFALYNLAGVGYWPSTVANYVVGGIVSFVLNKKFTFENSASVKQTLPRFVLTVAICWLLAYGIAKPLVAALLRGQSVKLQENGAMLAGMCLYTGLNYIGQRYFAFRDKS